MGEETGPEGKLEYDSRLGIVNLFREVVPQLH